MDDLGDPRLGRPRRGSVLPVQRPRTAFSTAARPACA